MYKYTKYLLVKYIDKQQIYKQNLIIIIYHKYYKIFSFNFFLF